jgi:hypothetical protein
MAGVSASRLILPVPIIPSRNMIYPKVQGVDSTLEPDIYDTIINKSTTMTARLIQDQCKISVRDP